MRILRFITREGRVLLGDDGCDGTATVLIDRQGIFGPSQEKKAAREMLSGMRALVADDDEFICKTIRTTLEKFECKCTTCRDGAEAIEAIHQYDFDLVVSDIVMPHHNGYEVFAESKKQRHGRPVVLITGFGYDPNHTVVRATEEGLEAVLYKPFTPGQLIEKIADAMQHSRNGQERSLMRSSERVDVGRILAPVSVGDVLCVGRNYPAPAPGPAPGNEQSASGNGNEFDPPGELELFMKPRSSLLDPGRLIRLPRDGETDPRVECEGELAVVIGTPACNVSEADALDCVLGLTIANDITARRWQTDRYPGAWMRGKGFDTFCPIGPVIVTPEEVDLQGGLEITTRINDRIVRQGNTRQMIRPVARLISEISRNITLTPGTLLLTGAPPRDPAALESDESLQPDDEVSVEIEGIGKLVNMVVGT